MAVEVGVVVEGGNGSGRVGGGASAARDARARCVDDDPLRSRVAQTFFVDEDIQKLYSLDCIVTVCDAKHFIMRLDDEKPEGVENEGEWWWWWWWWWRLGGGIGAGRSRRSRAGEGHGGRAGAQRCK